VRRDRRGCPLHSPGYSLSFADKSFADYTIAGLPEEYMSDFNKDIWLDR
jgi:hypothetical protein